jgi:Uma2 family endonuclease
MTEAGPIPRPIAREATRHPLSMDELLAMQAAGAFAGRRTQLLDGEIHEMPSDGLAHIAYAMGIARAVMAALPSDKYLVGVQTTLHLSEWNGPSPDVYVLAAGPLQKETDPARILLVVEVAVTNLKDDLTDAAYRYARHGVQEYWVVDVEGRQTHVHRAPVENAYPTPPIVPFSEELAPHAIPGFRLRIADLTIPPL